MQQVIADVLARRRDRAIAILLGLKDRECDSYLPRDVSIKLRKAILDQFNEMHDLCVDVMRSLDTGEVVLNEIYLQKLDELHAKIVKG